METEAKFRVAAEDLASVGGLQTLGIFSLAPAPAPEQQVNIYYDTADRRLAAARYGLRVRRVGERALITLKGPSDVDPDGVHRRAEHEFPGADPHPATWPPGVARELGLALTGGSPLAPTVVVATERRIIYVLRDLVPVAELCLDQGMLRASGHERPFTEIEIELLPDGTRADLTAITAALGALVRLEPEPRSKLQRALDLLNKGRGTP